MTLTSAIRTGNVIKCLVRKQIHATYHVETQLLADLNIAKDFRAAWRAMLITQAKVGFAREI
jgi:hypothetical protein